MRKYILMGSAIVVLMLGGVIFSVFAQGSVHDAAEISRDDLRVTVYNDGLALVQDTRTFDLADGHNRLLFGGISEQLVMNTVMVMAPGNGGGVTALQQQFRTPAPEVTTGSLIEANIGQQVTLIDRDGDEISGELINGGGQLVLRGEEGEVIVVNTGDIEEFRFAVLPESGSVQPGLELLLDSGVTGEQQITMVYITRGLGWASTNYNLNIDMEAGDIALTGWVTVSNNTDISFEDAELTLAAGNFDRLQFVSRDVIYASPTQTASPTATAPGAPGGGALPQTGGGGFGQEQEPGTVFFVDQRITLHPGDTRLVEFLPEADANARNVYIYDASPRVFNNLGYNVDPSFGATAVTTVQNFLEFSTDEEDGLGSALPAGGMRIFEQNETGVPLLIGDTAISYTPENETVRLFLDEDPDLRGERRQTEFISLSADAIQETFEVRLFNEKATPVTVTVPERLARSPNFEVVAANTPFEQSAGGIITFDVEVPAGGDVTIAYSVQYRRPE